MTASPSARRRGITGPQVTPAARRWSARLRLYVILTRALSGFDFSDIVLLASLAFVFVGLAVPSLAFAVVGFMLLPLTPIWTNVRLLIRGR